MLDHAVESAAAHQDKPTIRQSSRCLDVHAINQVSILRALVTVVHFLFITSRVVHFHKVGFVKVEAGALNRQLRIDDEAEDCPVLPSGPNRSRNVVAWRNPGSELPLFLVEAVNLALTGLVATTHQQALVILEL